MKHHAALASLALATLAALACQSDDSTASGSGAQLRDSAGIRIVENARPPEGSRLDWRIGPEPALSIGELEGEEAYMLQLASDAVKLTDGRIVVVNRGSLQLRVYDAVGTHLATWGGRGLGPGEFTDLHQVERLPGDSVIVWGWLPGTITVFDKDGKFARTFGPERRQDDRTGYSLGPLAVTDDGSILASPYPRSYLTDPLVVQIWDTEGGFRSSLGRHPSWEWLSFNDAWRWREKIFGRKLAREPWGDLVVVSPTDRYEIKAFAKDGTLAKIVRRAHEPRSPTQAHAEAYIEERVSRIPSEDIRAQQRREYRSIPVAERFPAFASVIADALDHLWVEEYEVEGEERPGSLWTVFDPEGRVLGFVETPDGLEIYEIGEDYILGRVKGELDVESVQVWSLDRSGR